MSRSLSTLLNGGARPLAKVCGLTRQADIAMVARAGADLVGLVSYPASPRHLVDMVIVALANSIREADAQSVLVTVDADRAATDKLVHEAQLDAVQLSGDERPGDWRGVSYGLLRRVGVDADARAEIEAWKGIANAFVLDHPASAGGSGRSVDLGVARELSTAAPCLLAGGLTADSACFKPPGPARTNGAFRGFDASSRLERIPGVKDPELVERFITAAHHYSSLTAQ